MTRRKRAEPYKVSAPRAPSYLIDERGVVHVMWQLIEGAMRMGCGYYSLEWHDAKHSVTCVWCIAGYLPWLHWGPGAPENLEL